MTTKVQQTITVDVTISSWAAPQAEQNGTR